MSEQSPVSFPTASKNLLVLADSFTYASFWRRAAALMLDMVFVMVGIILLQTFSKGSLTTAIAAVPLQGFLFWFYVFYQHGKDGQTWAKRLLKIKVVTVDGNPVDFPTSGLRSIICFLESVPWVLATMLALSKIPSSMYLPLEPEQMRALELSLRPEWYGTTDWIVLALFLTEISCYFLTSRRQSLADLIAGTVAINVKAPDR